MGNNNRIGFPPPLVHLCALWKGVDVNGQQFFSGTIGNSRIFIFPNRNKKSEDSPDYYLSLGQRLNTDDWRKSKENKLVIEVRHTHENEIKEG